VSKTCDFLRAGIGAALLAAAVVTAACGGGEQGTTTAAPPAGSAPADVRASSAPAAPEPATVVDLFPAAPARDLVLNNCGTCHNVACTVIGQRSAARWEALKEGHADKVKGVDLDAIFSYLQVNFDESKPEPKVPSKFLEGGCTPF
jgi:hypothetical protein